MIEQIVFTLAFVSAFGLFFYRLYRIYKYIKIAKPLKLKFGFKRVARVLKIAIAQSKIFKNPLVGLLHAFVFWGFIIVNVEMLEITIDGVFGTHRSLSFLGDIYPMMIAVFELFALSVIIACVIFLGRRNIIKLKRFWNKEMTTWPRSDANIILITEILLMCSVLIMNATDTVIQSFGNEHYPKVGAFLVSGYLTPLFSGMSESTLIFIERFCWWFHIIGVLIFMNYVTFSKHLHIFFSFFNVYYSKFSPLGKMMNIPCVTNEVKIMLNLPSADPCSIEQTNQFGAKDAQDLYWKNLLDAFSCTECGRCTSVCPANITGKKLSPRKIVMDLRDRVEEIGPKAVKQGNNFNDGKSLLDQISTEELWACTTCNACVQECPVNIDPLAIILELRRFLVLEKGSAPGPINAVFANIENNGAPWQYSADDRMLWAEELSFKSK
ncbi:MAG: (Fe-S)-binding protein [Bacteroidetes bacterium]|nr:(Fe-S)-binding protein [Bacteroidota bacterium]